MPRPAHDTTILARLAAGLEGLGLIMRGGFHPDAGDRVPPLADGSPGRSLLLVGNAGPAMWRAFSATPEAGDGAADPLDRWTARVLTDLAADFEAQAFFPFGGTPYRPFQRWAMKAEGLKPSPLGILMHPRFGLWHAYRGALLFRERLDLPAPRTASCPCDACLDRPCLQGCPVSAFSPAGYDVEACVQHVSGPEGQDCRGRACRARRACPLGRAYHYDPDQASFHMEAFLASQTGGRT